MIARIAAVVAALALFVGSGAVERDRNNHLLPTVGRNSRPIQHRLQITKEN